MTEKIKMTMEQAREIVRMNKMSCEDCCMVKQCDVVCDDTDCSDVVLHAARMLHASGWRRETATRCLIAMHGEGFTINEDDAAKQALEIVCSVDALDAALKEGEGDE